jgi:hypothetical protein
MCYESAQDSRPKTLLVAVKNFVMVHAPDVKHAEQRNTFSEGAIVSLVAEYVHDV